MSYRIYVNKKQCLGNNEFPECLRKALNKQGARIYPYNDCTFHNFEIKDLQSIIEALEQYIFDTDEITKERLDGKGIADYTDNLEKWKHEGNLTYHIDMMVNCGYLFVTYNFLKYIEDDYEKDYDIEKHRIIYKIKEGHHVYMSGF